MKRLAIVLLSVSLLAGCSPLENNARDAAAAAQGFIQAAQKNHFQECSADPSKDFPCRIINQAVGAQNLLVSSIELYCSWPANPDPASLKQYAGQPCARKKEAAQSLANAIKSLNSIISEYKLAAGGTK